MLDPSQIATALGRPLPQRPLVSVVVTLFNSEQTLESCVRSLLGQTYRNIEVVLSDDGSTDGTIAIAERLCAEDHRVRLVRFGGNHGTYWAKNFGILNCRGDVITFSDSDDLNDEGRIQQQLEALRKPGVVVSTCSYSREDEHGNPLPIPGSRGFAFITQMMRREVFGIVGFFDSVRTSADDEMLQRIRLVFGTESHENVGVRLYTALVREGSLSHNEENPRYSPVTRGLSPPRQAYAAGFRRWHRSVIASGGLPYMPFPVINRPFAVDPKLEIRSGRFSSDALTIVASGAAASRDAIERLRRHCVRLVACQQAGGSDSEATSVKLTIMTRGPGSSMEEPGREDPEFATGYVVLCDLDAALPPDFVQRAILSVETAPGRVGRQALDLHQDLLRERGMVAFHTEGLDPPSSARSFLDGWCSPRVAGEGNASSGGGRQARQQSPQGVPVGGFPVGAGTVASRGGLSTAGAMLRQLVKLLRKFAALWSKSELLLAAWLSFFTLVAIAAQFADFPRVSGVAITAMAAGVAAGVLMIARRTRLIADPLAGAEGRQRVVDFLGALRGVRGRIMRPARGDPRG